MPFPFRKLFSLPQNSDRARMFSVSRFSCRLWPCRINKPGVTKLRWMNIQRSRWEKRKKITTNPKTRRFNYDLEPSHIPCADQEIWFFTYRGDHGLLLVLLLQYIHPTIFFSVQSSVKLHSDWNLRNWTFFNGGNATQQSNADGTLECDWIMFEFDGTTSHLSQLLPFLGLTWTFCFRTWLAAKYVQVGYITIAHYLLKSIPPRSYDKKLHT